MITDALLLLSNAQNIVGSSTIVSTNVIDLGVEWDLSMGEDLVFDFSVDATVAGSNITVQVITSASSAMSSPVVLASTGLIQPAQGTRFALETRNVGSNGLRYLAVQYVIAGTTSTGAITAMLVNSIEDRKTYASGFAVL